MDFIFIICAPVWPGKPATAHWGIVGVEAITHRHLMPSCHLVEVILDVLKRPTSGCSKTLEQPNAATTGNTAISVSR